MKEKNWFMKHKMVTVILVIALISIVRGIIIGPETPTTNQNIQKEESKIVFDIPSLIGKNVDEVVSLVGQPTKGSVEAEEEIIKQLASKPTEWDFEINKDNQTLLVTYELETKEVKDLFISGDNKEELLEMGNLKENDSNYSLEFIKQQNDPTKITGVVITKK